MPPITPFEALSTAFKTLNPAFKDLSTAQQFKYALQDSRPRLPGTYSPWSFKKGIWVWDFAPVRKAPAAQMPPSTLSGPGGLRSPAGL